MSPSIISNHPALGSQVTETPPAAPTTSILPPKPIAQHGLLIQAVATLKSAVTITGVQLKDLYVHNTSLTNSASFDGSTTPGEFVVRGKIELFGNKNITAELDVWHGAPPPGVTIGSAAPSIQRGIIKGPVALSQLIPSFEEGPTLQNVSIYHQNYLYDSTRGLGYELDADLVFDSSHGLLSSILSKVFGLNEPTAHIRVDFGPDQSWSGPVTASTLTIEGSFVGHTYAATPGIHITNVCVRLIYEHVPNNAATCNVEVFGTLHLAPPGGSVLPLELEYTVKDVGGVVQFTAGFPSGIAWNDPMGARGFALNPVTFSSSLPLSDPWKDLALDIAATLQYQSSVAHFTGSYVLGGASSLHANIQQFDLGVLVQLYESIHHEPLKAPRVDVTMDSAELSIASGEGFSATLTNVNIAGHGSGNAALSFSSAGAVVRADLGNVQFGDVDINSARTELDLYPASSAESSSAMIYGDVKVESLEIDVAVHLYPSGPDVVPKRTEWTMFAELTALSDTLALSKIEPRLKGTDFDLALKNVIFIAASRDDPEVGTVVTGGYQPKEGTQVFATFDEIPVFNSLANCNVAGLVLNASWSRTAGFSLNVILPVARHLTFGKGITSTPVTLSLEMTPSVIDKSKLIPALQVTAGLNIPVAHSPEPLLFQMILTAMRTDATIAADLKGNWVDPLGISHEVTIGPNLALQADLSYVTGLSGALFEGRLAIGNTDASVVISVNEDPLKEMLYTEIDSLSFTDVISFAEKLLHLDIPPPPGDFLGFEKAKLYICPAGLTVQGVTYPPGFSFEGDMILFGKRAGVSCGVSDTLLSINGSVDEFRLGPLSVSGIDGTKQAVVHVQVGKDVQRLQLDGVITLYGEINVIHLLANMQPLPEVSFTVDFKLTELLTFKVDASLIGGPNFKDLSEADFNFSTDLEQHHLDYIYDELLNLLTRAERAAEEGIEAVRKRVVIERAALDSKIDQAKIQLKAAQATWEAHQKDVTETNLKIINDYSARIKALQDSVTSADRAFDAAVQKARTNSINAEHDRQVKIQGAQNDLANAKRKAASSIGDAKNCVAAAQSAMTCSFGSVEKSIEDAKRSVQDLQNQINSINKEISRNQQGPLYKRIMNEGLVIDEVALEGSLEIAQGVLEAAQVILESSDYLAKKSALDIAQQSLDLAKQSGPTLGSDFQWALTNIDQVTRAAVDGAAEAELAVQNGVEKVALDSAVAALAAYKCASDTVLQDANTAIAELAKSAEHAAFEAATTALATAQGAMKGFDTIDSLLSEAEKGCADILNMGKVILNAGSEVLKITSIHLSGSLTKSTGGSGLSADVKGTALNKPFAINVVMTPSKVENFLMDMLHALEREMKDALHL